jgi:predicted HicB family RNase H-like nuclease
MMLEHKGYIATIELDEDAGHFYGEVANTRAVLTFVGNSVDQLKREFGETIAVYEELCRERGESPEKPYSGSFMLRLSPEMHRRAAEKATRTGKSLNSFVKEALAAQLGGEA